MEQEEKSENTDGRSKAHFSGNRIGIGMDCSVTPLKRDMSLVQTTDFFYPLCEDPYIMGRITCANVLSDLYAMGVTECDNMLMLLAVSNKMTDKERDIIVPLMIKGFKDCACEAGTSVTGGQTVINPWLTMGGVATSVCSSFQFIAPNSAVAGDVLLLTKPLGTQVAVTAYRWLDQPEWWDKLKQILSKEEVQTAYLRAIDSMARLNKVAACLMHKYKAHGATDITGYGLLGHAQNLAKVQKNEVSLVIHNIPVIAKMTAVAKAFGKMFPILQGYSVETSGGLLICLPRIEAIEFMKDIKKQEGREAWIVGMVEKGNRTASVIKGARVIEIPRKNQQCFGLRSYYRPPEAFLFMSTNPSLKLDGRAFDIYSYGLLCLCCFTGGWFESMVPQSHTWHKDLYPLLFDALQLPFFKSQIERFYPTAKVEELEVASASNLIQSALTLQPECRPEASVLLQHGFFSNNFEKITNTDIAWTQRNIWPENYSQVTCDETNSEKSESTPNIVPENNPQASHNKKMANAQSSDYGTNTVPGDKSQATNDKETANVQSSDYIRNTVPGDYSQATNDKETANVQSLDYITNTVPGDNSETTNDTETANVQSSEYIPNTIPADAQIWKRRSGFLSGILTNDSSEVIHDPKITLYKIPNPTNAIHSTKIYNLHSSEHFSEINSKVDSTAVHNKNLHIIHNENNLQVIHDPKITEVKTSSHERFGEFIDMKQQQTANVNEEAGEVLKETRPRSNLFNRMRKWRIWKICTCSSKKSKS